MKRTRSLKKYVESSSSDSDEQPLKKSPVLKSNGAPKEESSSSESDIENYLHKPGKLDLNSDFFKANATTLPVKTQTEEPSRLSDSDSNPEESPNHPQAQQPPILTQFNSFQNYTKQIEEARKHVENYEAKIQKADTQTDILHLLTEGESKLALQHHLTPDDLHSSDFESCDSEQEGWEEIKNNSQGVEKEKSLVPAESLQIVVNLPENVKKKKKGVDFLAAMKRRLNRIRKENQVLVHQVHLLCWLAHGNFVNSIINRTDILATALSLMPSEKSFPSDRTDLNYLEQILGWFKKAVKTAETPKNKKTLPLDESLLEQMRKKEAKDSKMLAIIFVALLRSFGVQTRLVLNLQVEPLRPPASDLHYVGTKNDPAEKGKSKPGVKITVQKATPVKKNQNKPSLDSAKKVTQARPVKLVENSKAKRSKSAENATTKPVKVQKEAGKLDVKPKRRVKSIGSLEPVEDKPQTSTKSDDKLEVVENAKDKRSISPENATTKLVKVQKAEKLDVKSKRRVKSTGSLEPVEDNPQTSTKSDDKLEVVENAKDKRSKSAEKTIKKLVKEEKESEKLDVKPKRRVKSTVNLEPVEDKPDIKAPKKQTAPTRRSTRRTTGIAQLDGLFDTSDDSEMELVQLDGVTEKGTKPNLKNLKVTKNASQKPKEKRPNLKVLKKPVNQQEYSDSDSEFEPSRTVSFQKKLDQASADLKKLKEAKVKNGKPDNVKEIVVGLVKERVAKQKIVERTRLANKRKPSQLPDESEDSDYVPEPIKKKHQDSEDDFAPKTKVKRRVQVKPELQDNGTKKKKKGQDVWVEVFLESEEKWITVDVVSGRVHCVQEIAQRATHPICYVLSWDNNSKVKDVTQRYCPNFNTVTRKLRVNGKWWAESLKPFRGMSTPRDKEEDEDLARQQLDQPLPKSIGEYKDHPLYALRRHLLKFEAIYPPEPPTLGFIRGEAVYPRGCVFTLHSRDIWLKQAKVVKLGEQPYKIVKARPKWDKLSNQVITDQLLEIFGPWQVEDYVPPTAQNGVVPRNAFGNVDLFKPSMLPKGCVHLKLPGLNKVARKLNVDCASAIVGFDFHGGWSHPIYDGFVVCQEYEEQLISAWETEQDEIERKEQEKVDKRVYGNWKKLIRGLLIRERLKAKYDFGQPSTSDAAKKGRTGASGSRKK